ncbi:serine/threonine-protein kinase [Polyangium aurulentum]|uniref:serine/threonine-protein kinase n=1 Tax=Polyangium aurulentum TaxID=2567896 RepID=UPI00146B94A4|nr:serine/threonine-protein kinase [Polyangium aurulentum]UQA56808.1 serine/threonine protein kinase [Polyangium aurulentum]
MNSIADDSDFGDSLMCKVAAVEARTSLRELPRPMPGDRMGGEDDARFEIVEEIGFGSMSVVYRARDLLLERMVAIKLLVDLRGLSRGDATALCYREARAAAGLHHENVIRTFDVGMWNGSPFIVLEHIEGETLRARLDRGRLGWAAVASIMIQITDGLAHAHERGVVHRDLKPGNVLVLPDGTIKIIDFGIACSSRDLRDGAADALWRAGTPPYMAPEQWRGEPQDARTDIWAMGVVLFEMLTGRRPYEDAKLEELAERVTSAAPAPVACACGRDVLCEAEQIAARALQKDPAQRFETALEMRRALLLAAAPRRAPAGVDGLHLRF